ncbi:MAG: polysaccharide deacetylase family protein [Burkholderiales bacterium]|nr:polysaccharide deacetylase family protein [Burkholderiales bacterium]
MKKYLALKIDVDTLKGTQVGVPALVTMLKKYQAGATFLFSLGPDHTGRAIKRMFRKGFLGKVKRTSVVSNYGFPTLLYGTLLPGPDIGKRCGDILRNTRDDGFEVGIHTWDHVKWQDNVEHETAAWTRQEMTLAQDRFTEIFKTPARTHGAAGWQMSRHALRLTQEMGFDYCSDGRAILAEATPHFPVVNAEIIDCPQLPTTLPTLDELIGLDNCTEANAHDRLLEITKSPLRMIDASRKPMSAHVFTMHAELEGIRLLPIFEKLLLGWREQGYELVATETIYANLDRIHLPYFSAERGTITGRTGTLLMQGKPFLQAMAEFKQAA